MALAELNDTTLKIFSHQDRISPRHREDTNKQHSFQFTESSAFPLMKRNAKRLEDSTKETQRVDRIHGKRKRNIDSGLNKLKKMVHLRKSTGNVWSWKCNPIEESRCLNRRRCRNPGQLVQHRRSISGSTERARQTRTRPEVESEWQAKVRLRMSTVCQTRERKVLPEAGGCRLL